MAKIRRQVYAAIAGSVGVACSSMSYGWLSPALGQLSADDGPWRLQRWQLTRLAVLIEAGCLLSSVVGVAVLDRLGRRTPLLATGPLYAAAWALTLWASDGSVAPLYAKRVLEGVGMGVLFTVGPVFLAEIASPRTRGSVLLGVSLAWYVGMLAQYCLGTFLSYETSALVALCVPLATTAMLWPLPESPYYLLMRGHRRKALESLAWYRDATDAPHQVSAELSEMERCMSVSAEGGGRVSLLAALLDPRFRRAFEVMAVVVVGTIMTGITTIYAFATEIFADGWVDENTCSLLVASLFLAVSAVSCAIVDRVGRRPLLVATSLGCCLSNGATALLPLPPLLTVGAYCLFVSVGLGPILVVYQGELFPEGVRASGASLAQAAVTACSMLALQLHSAVRDEWGASANYALYSVVGAVCTVHLYLRAPETKHKTLAEVMDTVAPAPLPLPLHPIHDKESQVG